MHEGLDPKPVLPSPRPTPRRARHQRVVAAQEPPAGLPPISRPPSQPFLLATKIVPPRPQQGLIDRPRLLHILAEGSHRRLTVIKAPAGFGKTSLAIAWLSHLQSQGARVAWLSMDEDDDEPARFLSHLAKSLQLACGPAVGLTVDVSLARPRDVISILINELAQVEQDLYLFLDDYHLLSVAAIHDAVALLLSHAPPNLRVVIGTREDPPLPLARLRARNALLEIDATMLRFSFDETQQFLAHECEGGLPFPSVSTLHTATEGWAAALRLSVSMLTPGRLKAGLGEQSPSGTSRPIAEYLEDMLASQPPELVDFMLRTSILDRLSAPLCAVVTGAADSGESQRLLDTLATRHLLLDPLDLDGHWFRYHQLLRDYLARQLAMQPGIDVAALHRSACQWYATEALWIDAVRHALAAGDAAEALAMIARCAMTLVRQGDLLTLLGWQRHLPADMLRGQSEVRLALARGMALAMRFNEALAMVESLEHDAAASAVADQDHCLWSCQAIRALLLGLRDDPPGALRLAQDCLDRRPASPDTWTLNALTNVVRFGYWKAGQLDRLYDTPWIPYSVEEDQRNLFTSVYRLCLLGMAELQQMHFALAERHLARSMHLAELHAGPQSTAAALCAPLLAQLRYEQDDLDAAEALLTDRMPLISAAVLLDSVLVAYVLLIRIRAVRGDPDQAHGWVDQAQSLGRQRGWHRLTGAVLFERLRLLLEEGRTKEAAACGAELDRMAQAGAASGQASAMELERYRTLGTACLAMAERRPADAIPLLDALLARFPQGRPDYLALRARTMLALTCLAAGERRRAVEECGHVLAAIESAGAFRTILDHGPGVSALLLAVREDTPATAKNQGRLDTLDRLLERCHARYPLAGPGEKEKAAAGEREALSARERGILELIAAGQSNKEIARTLGIAPETVKSHIKSIFAKLSVEKRAQAVARAQSLGLVAGG